MPTEYLYVDDERALAPKFAERVENGVEELRITVRQPLDFSLQVDSLVEWLEERRDNGSIGVILDWRLDQAANEEGARAGYRGGALAQELRTRATEGDVLDTPIVMWSVPERIRGSFSPDNTAQDLFDWRFMKDDIIARPAETGLKLRVLADGYQTLRSEMLKENGPMSILGLDSIHFLDPRIVAAVDAASSTPIHKLAAFILHDLIGMPGALIREHELAALLGVDREASEGWSRMLDTLEPQRYTGVFAEAWPRWWVTLLESWWLEMFPDYPTFRIIPAEERVGVLESEFGNFDLRVASPIVDGYSTKYSAICVATGKPLDPTDGLRVLGRDPEPWQQHRYVSAQAALERKHVELGYRIHPMDRERYDWLIEDAQEESD